MSPKLPVITAKEVLGALKRAGFYIHHQVGSHAQLKHPEKRHLRITIPIHSKDLNRTILMNILKQAELSVEEFIDLL